MTYLSADEFVELTGKEVPNEFDQLEKRASFELDVMTRSFYQFNDLEEDIRYRRNQFKRGMAYQILYLNSSNFETTDEENESPDSIRVGETTITYNRMDIKGGKIYKEHSVSVDAVNALRRTGLLYRGAGG